MRILFTLLMSMIFLAPKAQTHLPAGSGLGFMPWQPFAPLSFTPLSMMIDGNHDHHWQLRPYTGVSAGYLFLGGGAISYLTAPVGVLFYRPLNNNVTAFAGVSVAPTVFSFSRLYHTPLPGSDFSGLSVDPSIQGGLMYTNDARTFSISGSIIVERGSYPVYLPSRPASYPK